MFIDQEKFEFDQCPLLCFHDSVRWMNFLNETFIFVQHRHGCQFKDEEKKGLEGGQASFLNQSSTLQLLKYSHGDQYRALSILKQFNSPDEFATTIC